MRKVIIITLAVLMSAGMALGQTYTDGVGIQGIDILGAHQNGGRGCVACHAPHSGGRGTGGVLRWNPVSGVFETVTVTGVSGNDALWGQDLVPVLAMGSITTGGGHAINLTTTSSRIITGMVMCLSCHDGNVAKGAMMTNQSFEQAAGLLPASYLSQPIPTLLGEDGGTKGNYANDHPIGPTANIGTLAIKAYLDLDSTSAPTRVVLKTAQPDARYTTFQANYGLPAINTAGAYSGFAVDPGMTTADQAYVVCTTCHSPHNMYTAVASATNPIAGHVSGTFPSYFFIAGPYNRAANVANGTKASSATQFCRQCHFGEGGGANEEANINLPTAF